MNSATPRRSLRLIEAGYYTENGTPRCSYRERISRVFKRRIHGHEKDSGSSGSSYNMNQIVGNLQSESSPVLVQDNGTQTESYTETYRRRVATRDTDTRQTKRTKAKEGNKSWSPPWMRIIFFCLFNLFSYVTTKIYIDQTIEQGINRYLVDTMPNFALESQGARVLEDLSSDTYMGKENPSQICKKKLYWWCSNKKYRTVIQAKPFLNPGECWPFAGDQGHLVISLSHAVHISHVTLSHMAKSQCPHGTISSAPRRFSVYGMTTPNEEGVFLGKHVYDSNGAVHQSFPIQNPDEGVYKFVKLKIESNWGNTDYTCLYGFKVHGKLHL